MKIDLSNYAEGAYWHSFFELFRRSEYKSLWKILGVSEKIISEPESIAGFARNYLETHTPKNTENTLSYRSNLEDAKETIRLGELAKLTSIFARIIDHYGLEVAIELYRLADQAFLHEKGRFWSIWLELFTGDLEIYFSLTKYLDKADHDQFKEIVNRQLSILKEDKMKIVEELPEQFLGEKIVHVENGIERNCAIRIWQEIDTLFEKKSKEKIYQWGFDNVDYLITKEEWSVMKSNCFLISENSYYQ